MLLSLLPHGSFYGNKTYEDYCTRIEKPTKKHSYYDHTARVSRLLESGNGAGSSAQQVDDLEVPIGREKTIVRKNPRADRNSRSSAFTASIRDKKGRHDSMFGDAFKAVVDLHSSSSDFGQSQGSGVISSHGSETEPSSSVNNLSADALKIPKCLIGQQVVDMLRSSVGTDYDAEAPDGRKDPLGHCVIMTCSLRLVVLYLLNLSRWRFLPKLLLWILRKSVIVMLKKSCIASKNILLAYRRRKQSFGG